jgi:hypothetical protein
MVDQELLLNNISSGLYLVTIQNGNKMVKKSCCRIKYLPKIKKKNRIVNE